MTSSRPMPGYSLGSWKFGPFLPRKQRIKGDPKVRFPLWQSEVVKLTLWHFFLVSALLYEDLLLTIEQGGGLGHWSRLSRKSIYNFSWPFEFSDSQTWIKNTVFNPQLVDFADAKPMDTEGWLYLYLLKKKICI